MEDCCAVCAEPLEWLAYGPCGHSEVCSTCTARLRFILDDKCCCICKQECPTVFVTKALGDYTKSIKDFIALSAGANDGKVGDNWFHSDTQAYFDDEQHYKMIKAMCRLSCSVCEKNSLPKDSGNELQKRDREFKHIDQLRRHLYHVHKLSMCNLCLEGRKVFVGEQKLYTRAQLDRHLSKGDSEVDGSEIERGGFMGHPICGFCRKRFYGDNELYMHMQTEHYTCHICQRSRPGHYDYYQNYNALEAHFSQDHFLCENPDCLAKKFIVFSSESELKRHNASEHAGNMSRSQRNAALQIPVSFQYRRSGDEHEFRRGSRGQGRGRGHNLNDHLSATDISSAEIQNVQKAIHNSMLTASAENVVDSMNLDPMPSFLSSEAVASSSTIPLANAPPRYLTAVSQRSVNSALVESAFPPLPGISENVGQTSPRYRMSANRRGLNSSLEEAAFPPLNRESENVGQTSKTKGKKSTKSMASVLRGNGGHARVLNVARSRQTVDPSIFSSLQSVSSFVNQTTVNRTNVNRTSSRNLNHLKRPVMINTNGAHPRVSAIANDREMVPQSDEFPPILVTQNVSTLSVTENQSTATNKMPLLSAEETRASNRALIGSIRSGLGGDKKQFEVFKDLSAQFRNGTISAKKYHTHISQLGLSHLVLELARLCPDKDKQRELLEANNVVMKNSQNAASQITSQIMRLNTSNNINSHWKGKKVDADCSEEATPCLVPDSTHRVGNTSDQLEVLSKNGYRTTKGKSKPWETNASSIVSGASGLSSDEQVDQRQMPPPMPDKLNLSFGEKWACNVCTLLNSQHSMLCVVCGSERPDDKVKEPNHGGKEKQKKRH
ncbi:uncharacterized protein LOC131077755 [Cryptomeria japonica]|uniref:uncharacterized protein LOC131077755 n=1 Tax=Cryptomeria japonica TaxID=3369 RepID=UPI0027D9D7AE|nr:uncharacterized protein LOC131077755 [Cryptomeria japonica]